MSMMAYIDDLGDTDAKRAEVLSAMDGAPRAILGTTVSYWRNKGIPPRWKLFLLEILPPQPIEQAPPSLSTEEGAGA